MSINKIITVGIGFICLTILMCLVYVNISNMFRTVETMETAKYVQLEKELGDF